MAKRETSKAEAKAARPGPKHGAAARRKSEREDRKFVDRVAKALAVDEGCGRHLAGALAGPRQAIVGEVCRLHLEGRNMIPDELEERARRARVYAKRIWKLLNNPDARREQVERAKMEEAGLIEAARRDRQEEIEAALRFMAEDDEKTGIRAAAHPNGTRSEKARLRCELAAMESGRRGEQARAVMAELREIEEKDEARRIALRVDIEAEQDGDSLCQPCAETIRRRLKHWQESETWSEGRGPSAEDLRRILGMSRQAISAAARRGRWNKKKRGRDKPLTPGQVASVLRDYAKAGGEAGTEAMEAARMLSGMSACLRK